VIGANAAREGPRARTGALHALQTVAVPKDRYHRFFFTDRRAIRCVRLFKDRNGWVPHYRQL
jgi:cupin superfamily acireductone dioxygenase involved in methionine salvage